MRYKRIRTPNPIARALMFNALRKRDYTEVHSLVFKMDAGDAGKLLVSPAMMDRLREEGGSALMGVGLKNTFGEGEVEILPFTQSCGMPVVVSNKLPFLSKKPTKRDVKRQIHRKRAMEAKIASDRQKRENEFLIFSNHLMSTPVINDRPFFVRNFI